MCTSSLAPVWWGAIVRHLSSSLAEPASFQGAAVPRVGEAFLAEDEALQHSYHFLSVPSNSQGNWSSWQRLEPSSWKCLWVTKSEGRESSHVIGIVDKTPIDSDKSTRMPNSADFWCHLSGLFCFAKTLLCLLCILNIQVIPMYRAPIYNKIVGLVDPITYRLTSKSHWSFNIGFNKSHKRRRREVSVMRRRAAIVLPLVLPNSPLFCLCLCVQTLCEQAGRSQEAGKRAARGLAGS